MNFYNKHILPRLINIVMKSKYIKINRADVVGKAFGSVLEIGFGSGLNLPYYKNITKLYAIDPSRGLYNIAKKRMEKVFFPIEFFQVSVEKIPLPDNSIDSVVSTWNFCSISNSQVALKEISRVLKPGGIFLFIEHGESSNFFIMKIQKLLTPIWKLIAGGCCLDKKIDQLIIDAGFEIKNLEKIQQKPQLFFFFYKGVAIPKNK